MLAICDNLKIWNFFFLFFFIKIFVFYRYSWKNAERKKHKKKHTKKHNQLLYLYSSFFFSLLFSSLVNIVFFIFFIFSQEFHHDYVEEWPSICGVKRYVRRMYSDRKQICLNRVPILKWLPSYKLNYLFHDFVAGFTVGLTAIPQGIAYAVVAGLPPQYGLYSGFMGSFVYFLLGSCKDITIGKFYIHRTHTHARTRTSKLSFNDFQIIILSVIWRTNERFFFSLVCVRVWKLKYK